MYTVLAFLSAVGLTNIIDTVEQLSPDLTLICIIHHCVFLILKSERCNPIALRMTKTPELQSFGHSECSRVNVLILFHCVTLLSSLMLFVGYFLFVINQNMHLFYASSFI